MISGSRRSPERELSLTFLGRASRLRLAVALCPRRQYTITLEGEAEIEVGDGMVKRVGPGDVLLAEDLTGQGHITRVVGSQARFYAVVPLP